MKLIKYFLAVFLFIGAGIATWFFYPQYQIYKIKKHAAQVQSNANYVSYLDYYRHMKTTHISHLAIGDSVIHGYGAAENSNLVYQFSEMLGQEINKKIDFKIEGINGITSGELKELVLEGKFDEEIKKADIITINVGGNDILRTSTKGKNFQNVFQTFTELQTAFSKNLSDITTRIKTENPKATIIFLELYNPLSPTNQMYPLADQLLPKWNLKIYEVAGDYSNTIVIETTKAINAKKLENLSPDGVHPNAAGYMAIAEQMIYQFKNEYRKESV